jgi:hypothetical protein
MDVLLDTIALDTLQELPPQQVPTYLYVPDEPTPDQPFYYDDSSAMIVRDFSDMEEGTRVIRWYSQRTGEMSELEPVTIGAQLEGSPLKVIVVENCIVDRLITLEEVSSGSYHQRADNPEAFIEKANRNIAIGIHNSMLHWSPDVIVLGGGMINYNRVSFEEIVTNIKQINTVFAETPRIVKSNLGDVGGLHGGIAYLKNRQNLMSS